MKDVVRQFTKKVTQMTLKYVKRCSVSLSRKDIQLKPHPEDWQKLQSLPAYSAGETVEKETLIYCWLECVSVKSLWRAVEQDLSKLHMPPPSNPTARNLLQLYMCRVAHVSLYCSLFMTTEV